MIDSPSPRSRLQVGIDLVRVSRVEESLARFGDRFMRRVFTEGEIAYATSTPSLAAERFAARMAAKEATVKALRMAHQGVGWRQIEVRRDPSGACELELHGTAREIAAAAEADDLCVSLSHEGDYATAVVVTRVRAKPESHSS
ncbi:MAG: holo-ACP synthase [Polyangiaceae bacterium]|jgi:holo-[acyl-carrier protein] synthase